MLTGTILISLLTTTLAAEISSSYALLEKQGAFKPDMTTAPVDQRSQKSEDLTHPIFRGVKNDGRARIEMVKSDKPVVNHDMLSDQPMPDQGNDRMDSMAMGQGYQPAMEVAYPDVPYAPGYAYEPGYGPNNYETYSSLSNYMLEPDTSALGFIWSQMPDSRAVIGFVGRSLAWIINSFFIILLGSIATVGICSYTDLCTITFHGVGPIHEEMRSLVTPERLERISTAAELVKTAIDKYQKIQKVSKPVGDGL